MKRRTFVKIFLLIVPLLFTSFTFSVSWAAEEKYPSRYIEIYHGFTPGAALDAQSRFLAQALEKELGGTVVAVAKPGGGGVTATTALINAPPDGYTFAYLGFFNILQTLLASNGAFTLEDVRIVCQASIFGAGIGVPVDSQWKTIQDLVDFARKNPGVKYAHPGLASSVYVRMQNLNRNANLNLIGVPFKGDGETLASVLGKHVPFGCFSALSCKAQSEAGKLRILLSFDGPSAKYGLAPSIPWIATTFDKAVVDKDIPMSVYIIAPRKTPDKIINVVEKALKKVCMEQTVIDSAITTGMAIEFLDSKTSTRDLYRIMEQVKQIQKQ